MTRREGKSSSGGWQSLSAVCVFACMAAACGGSSADADRDSNAAGRGGGGVAGQGEATGGASAGSDAGTGHGGAGAGGDGGAGSWPVLLPACEGTAGEPGLTCYARSCKELLDLAPETPSGVYTLLVGAGDAEEPAKVYCDMSTSGGGWSLLFSAGLDFDRVTDGEPTSDCYTATDTCVSRAYAAVRIESDVMLQVSDMVISGSAENVVRHIITGVHEGSRGYTVRELMASDLPSYLDADDNSNVETIMPRGAACSTLPWGDWKRLVCDTRVITLADKLACNNGTAAIGGSLSSELPWDNCEGWPANTEPDGAQFPNYVRFWIR